MSRLPHHEREQRAKSGGPWCLMLFRRREELGFDIGMASRALGFTTEFVSSYERVAQNPTMDTMRRFCEVYRFTTRIDNNGVTVFCTISGRVLLSNWKMKRK